MSDPKLIIFRGQTEAHLYGPRDCSARVRSRWLFDRMTAVSRRHAQPFHLCMYLRRWRSASDTEPTRRSAGFDFHGRRTLSDLIPLLSYRIAFNELRLDLGCLLGQESALVGSRAIRAGWA